MKPITVPAGTKISIEKFGNQQITIFDNDKKGFEVGDILIRKDGGCPFIFRGFNENNNPMAYAGIDAGNNLVYSDLNYENPWVFGDVRQATEEEKKILLDTLEKDGRVWNPKTKQIEYILKAGDLAILWDEKKMDSFIAVIKKIGDGGYPFISHLCSSKNAIKCTSVEQYLNFIKE